MGACTINIEEIKSPSGGKIGKIVRLEGILDENNVDVLSKKVYELLKKQPKELLLLFNLEKLNYLNSKTIGYLTDWYQQVINGGGKIVIFGVNEKISGVMNVTGLSGMFEFFTDIEEAKSKLFE